MNKIIGKFFAVLIFTAISNISFSHSEAEIHIALTDYHLKAKRFANDMENRNAKSKGQYVNLVTITSKYIGEAKKALEKLNKLTPNLFKKISKSFHDAIKRHQTYAALHAKAIRIELKKQKYDEHKIKLHAKKIGECLSKAEQAHKELNRQKRINSKSHRKR